MGFGARRYPVNKLLYTLNKEGSIEVQEEPRGSKCGNELLDGNLKVLTAEKGSTKVLRRFQILKPEPSDSPILDSHKDSMP